MLGARVGRDPMEGLSRRYCQGEPPEGAPLGFTLLCRSSTDVMSAQTKQVIIITRVQQTGEWLGGGQDSVLCHQHPGVNIL